MGNSILNTSVCLWTLGYYHELTQGTPYKIMSMLTIISFNLETGFLIFLKYVIVTVDIMETIVAAWLKKCANTCLDRISQGQWK